MAGAEVAGAEVAGADVSGAEVAGAEVAGAEVAEASGAEVAGADMASVLGAVEAVSGALVEVPSSPPLQPASIAAPNTPATNRIINFFIRTSWLYGLLRRSPQMGYSTALYNPPPV